jgi:hypothetical protein
MPAWMFVFPSAQIWDAHKYLVANPCKPTPTITITTSLNKNINFPKTALTTEAMVAAASSE